jgi:hypothetical protein
MLIGGLLSRNTSKDKDILKQNEINIENLRKIEPYYNTKELQVDYQKQLNHQIKFMRKINYIRPEGLIDTRKDFNSYKHDYHNNDYDHNDHSYVDKSDDKNDDNVHHDNYIRDHHDNHHTPTNNNNTTNMSISNENLHENDKVYHEKNYSSPHKRTSGDGEILFGLKKLHYNIQKQDKHVDNKNKNDVDNIDIITYERHEEEKHKESKDNRLNENKLNSNQVFVTMEKNSIENSKYVNNNIIYVEGNNMQKKNASNDNGHIFKNIDIFKNKNANEKINFSENLDYVWDNNEDFYDLKNEKILEEDIDIGNIIKETEKYNLLNRGDPTQPPLSLLLCFTS